MSSPSQVWCSRRPPLWSTGLQQCACKSPCKVQSRQFAMKVNV